MKACVTYPVESTEKKGAPGIPLPFRPVELWEGAVGSTSPGILS